MKEQGVLDDKDEPPSDEELRKFDKSRQDKKVSNEVTTPMRRSRTYMVIRRPRSYIPEPALKHDRVWTDKPPEQKAYNSLPIPLATFQPTSCAPAEKRGYFNGLLGFASE